MAWKSNINPMFRTQFSEDIFNQNIDMRMQVLGLSYQEHLLKMFVEMK